jgi:hypothetical protein
VTGAPAVWTASMTQPCPRKLPGFPGLPEANGQGD